MATTTYDRTTPSGLKLAEAAAGCLSNYGEWADLVELAKQATKPMTSTTGGDLKEMLEVGFAATVVEMQVNQNTGGSPGNVIVGDTYTGAGGATGKILWINDGGSIADMVLLKTNGTAFVDGEALTNSGSNTNTGAIVSGTLNLTPGDSDNKYPGEKQFGVNAGSGADLYDAIIAVEAEMSAAQVLAAQLFQGK